VVTGRATSSRTCTSSGVNGDGVMRPTTIAATKSSPMVRGTNTAHSTPRAFTPEPVDARVGPGVVEDERPSVALHGVAQEGGVLPFVPRGTGCFREPPARRPFGSRRSPVERWGNRSRGPGPSRVCGVTMPIRSSGTSPASASPAACSTLDRSRCEFAACATARSAWYFSSPDQRVSIDGPGGGFWLSRRKLL
jgi:hypothetical protein